MLPRIKQDAQKGLDYLNFFLADVRDGIGPFLGIYLLSVHHWNLKNIGIASSIMTFAGVVAQSPAGALIDKLKNKHIIISIASLVIGSATLIIIVKPTLVFVSLSQVLVGVAAAFVGPCVAAVTLGIAGYKKLEQRTGRNEMFNHAGNVACALLSGIIGYHIGLWAIFLFTFFLSVAGVISLRLISPQAVDYRLARGFASGEKATETHQSSRKVFLQPQVLIFTLCCVLFHFANGAMLPLAGQYIVAERKADASIYMAACIVIAQLVMVPTAGWSSKRAVKGRKILMLCCLFTLAVRGFFYTLSSNPYYITSIQVLDGFAAGIFGVVSILMIADLTKGSGHFNFINGIVITATGIGASLSNVAAGYIAAMFSFKVAFLCLSCIAIVPAIIFLIWMKETRQPDG